MTASHSNENEWDPVLKIYKKSNHGHQTSPPLLPYNDSLYGVYELASPMPVRLYGQT